MLRWLILGFLIFALGSGLKDGWLVIEWSHLLHEIGFTSIDPDKPMNWSEFILDWHEKNFEKKSTD